MVSGHFGMRSSEVGVLQPHDGPYRLWTESNTETGFRDLVVAGVLAANPHNSQPWMFRVGDGGVDVLLDRARALGPVDPFLRQMHIGIGCAIENLCVAARARGLTLAATTALIADAEFMRATDAWFRWTPREVAEHADGPSLHCAGVAPIVEFAAILGPRQTPATFHASWLDTTRDVQLGTAPMFGRIVAAGGTRERFIEAGRLWEGVQLEATMHGLGMQPLDQALEASDRARQLADAPGEPPRALGPAGPRLAMMFRLGYPLRPAVASARRPLRELLLSTHSSASLWRGSARPSAP